MGLSSVSFEVAAQAILDAAVDPSLWNGAMDLVARHAGATGAVLLAIQGRAPGSAHSQSLQEGLNEYFRDGWDARDERMRGIAIGRAKGIFTDQDFASADELKTSDYHRGFLARYDCNWSAAINFSNPDDEWCMVVQRGDREGYFDDPEKASLLRFRGYLNQAATLARNLSQASAIGMLDAHETLNHASFLLDRKGLVIKRNAQADALLGNGLELSNRALRCVLPQDSLALNQVIAEIVRQPEPSGSSPAIAIARRRTGRPLMLQVIRLTGLAGAMFSPARALVIVSDPDRAAEPTPLDYAQKMFGLTQTEGRLVAHLERGLSLASAAEQMGSSVETARSHLKNVFAKTDTSRQADLLMLMGRLKPGA
jgi:DNA-binding CsgD family transcriptional regulator